MSQKVKVKHMTVKEAFDKAIQTFKVSMGEGGHYFTALGWRSPESGNVTGPFFIHVDGNRAVEVNETGEFRDLYPATAEGYFPFYSEKITSERP